MTPPDRLGGEDTGVDPAVAPASTGWIVEVLDRHHRVAQRVPVTGWPLVLGRGYGCDVILDDPHVAAQHARVRLDDSGHAVRVEDLGTRNGIRRVGGRAGRSGTRESGEIALKPGDWVETGRTRWRLCEADTPVPEELPLDEQWQVPPLAAVLALVVALASVAWQSWFAAVDADSPVPTVSVVLTVLVAVAGWAGLCAALTRLFQPRARMLDHLAWICAALVAVQAATWLADTVAYAFDWPVLSTWNRPLELAAVAVVLLGHLRIALGHRPRWARSIAVVLLMAGVGLSMLENWQSQRQLLPAQFMSVLRPPGWHLGRPRPVERVFESAQAQKAEIDALRKIDGSGDDPD